MTSSMTVASVGMRTGRGEDLMIRNAARTFRVTTRVKARQEYPL